jgi:hypothetical protein
MHAFIITNVLDVLHNHEELLAPTIITSQAQLAIDNLVNMVNSLPEDNLVLEYLKTITPSIEVLASINDNGVYTLLQSPLTFDTGYSTLKVPQVAGVYLWQFSDSANQYVGSAYDVKARLLNHISNINGNGSPLSFHTWAIHNGGLTYFSWGLIYATPNYFMDFLLLNPGYSLSVGETEILQALSKLTPLILESSLLQQHLPMLNASTNVSFSHLNWAPHLLMISAAGAGVMKAIEILDLSGSRLRPEPASIKLTARILNLSTLTIKRYLNNSTGFFSQVFGQQVLVGQIGVPYTETKIIHRRSINDLPLTLPGGPLTSLAPYFITAFYVDKLTYLGPFVSSRDLEKTLNPSKFPGNARPTRNNMTIHRARNLERLYKCELGSFYIAANPHFLPKRQPLKYTISTPWG